MLEPSSRKLSVKVETIKYFLVVVFRYFYNMEGKLYIEGESFFVYANLPIDNVRLGTTISVLGNVSYSNYSELAVEWD